MSCWLRRVREEAETVAGPWRGGTAELFRDKAAAAVAVVDAAADLVVLVEVDAVEVVAKEDAATPSDGVQTGAGFDARVTLCLFAGAGAKSTQ